MDCYACGQGATQRCSRCGNAYCADHGQDPSTLRLRSGQAGSGQALCDECLSPLNAAPSPVAFRVSLLGLLVASVLALWLLVRPPGLPGESSGALIPPPQEGSEPGAATPTPTAAGAVASPSPTPAPTPAPGPAGPLTYTVVEGDSWCVIAGAFDVDAAALAAANGRTVEDPVVLGEPLIIPQDLSGFTPGSCIP